MKTVVHRLPWLTLSVAVVALSLQAAPAAGTALQLDLGGLTSVSLFQWVTCHLVHWTTRHLAIDLAVFAILSWDLERRARGLWLTLLVTSGLVISLGVAYWEHELVSYRGLSGWVCALWGAWLVDFVHTDGLLSRKARVAFAFVGFSLVVGKAGWELAGTRALFAGDTFVPVASAHLLGVVYGAGFAWVWNGAKRYGNKYTSISPTPVAPSTPDMTTV